MSHKRTHIVIPEVLATEIDAIVGKRGRSHFLAEAARKELRRLKMLQALEKAAGAWEDSAHPELKDGAAQWVARVRASEEEQFKRRTTRRK